MSPAATPFLTTLGRYAELVSLEMAQFLGPNEASPYLYDLVRDYPSRGGKGIRPALLLSTCQAYGRSSDAALRAAVALEMLHNAFLIHDDVEDRSALRRGRPTLHELHGVGLAVNAGDCLAHLALQPLLDDVGLSNRLKERVMTELLTVARLTTEGQALDLGWRWHSVVNNEPARYLTMAGKKTCWYSTVAPLRIGAIIGSHDTVELRTLTRFGFYLGTAFQIRDDLLDLEGGTGSGKEPLGDLREGKPTLMLIHLVANVNGDDRRWLVEYLCSPPAERSCEDPLRVYELMQRHGSLTYASEYAARVEAEAHRAFEDAFAGVRDSEHLGFLRDVVPYMVSRQT